MGDDNGLRAGWITHVAGTFRKHSLEMNKVAKYTDTVSDTVYPIRDE